VQSNLGSFREARMRTAHIFITYSEEDGGCIATVSNLRGCSAFGGTALEALAELQPAITAWIEAQNNAGNPIPAIWADPRACSRRAS
jgi:predicted RNase H-like HicB family nuclease